MSEDDNKPGSDQLEGTPSRDREPDSRDAVSAKAAQGGEGTAFDESELVQRLAFASLNEQRRARRWGVFFKLLALAYLVWVTSLLWLGGALELEVVGKTKEHTALIDVEGLIAPDEPASADNVVSALREAFKAENARGVVLRINSPGGSPVQSRFINQEIQRLREEYPDTPLYAVVTDVGASGAYYIAVAADKIFVDPASIVGSIGVRMDSFGFVEAIEKLGVERRLLTAGDHKALLDPFLPVDEFEREHIRSLLDEIHDQFIEAVKDGRGERLSQDEELFSGLVWTGEQAVALGLADDFASPGEVARDIIEAEEIVDYTRKRPLAERLADRIGTAIAQGLVTIGGADRFQLR
jgi:protease-4